LLLYHLCIYTCSIELANGKVVRLAQAPSANSSKSKRQQQLDKNADPALTGCTVWDGAVVLSQYLTAPGSAVLAAAAAAVAAAAAAAATGDGASSAAGYVPSRQQQQQQQEIVSLELGAGTGAVSLSLLAAGAVHRAVITDIPDMTSHLQFNVQHNSALFNPTRAVVKPLRWGEGSDVKGLAPYGPPFQLILGSDLVYYSYSEATPHSRLLLLALQQLAGPDSHIYLALSLHHNPQGEGGGDIFGYQVYFCTFVCCIACCSSRPAAAMRANSITPNP
jgi:predicted nicotinamide N-methyase